MSLVLVQLCRIICSQVSIWVNHKLMGISCVSYLLCVIHFKYVDVYLKFYNLCSFWIHIFFNFFLHVHGCFSRKNIKGNFSSSGMVLFYSLRFLSLEFMYTPSHLFLSFPLWRSSPETSHSVLNFHAFGWLFEMSNP